MKEKVKDILALVTVLSIIVIALVASSYKSIETITGNAVSSTECIGAKGDLNNDGNPGPKDIIIMQKILDGKIGYLACADINEDGLVTNEDLTMMKSRMIIS